MEIQTYPEVALIGLSNHAWKLGSDEYMYLAKTGKNIRASGYVK